MIRTATLADAEAIDRLIHEKALEFLNQGSNHWEKYLHPRRREIVANDLNTGQVFVVEQNDRIIASVSLQPRTAWDEALWQDEKSVLYVHRLVVDSAYKGQHIGERLLTHAIDQMKTTLRLDCVASNTFLNTYYRQFGFEYKGETNGYALYEKRWGDVFGIS